MATRTIEAVVSNHGTHFVGDGFRVHNFIPTNFSMQRMDPIIMMDYNAKFYFSPSTTSRGVGVHPHRGFETVTIAYKGKIAHHDSSGGGGIIGEGDVQWMTAARGVLHKEYHEEQFSKMGGDFQMVQLWINLPAKDKMSDPKYQAIKNEEINRFYLDNNQGEIEVIAGNYHTVQGKASTFTPIHLLNVRLKKGGQADFSFPSNYNTSLLVIEGELFVNDKTKVPTDHFVLMANDGADFSIVAAQDAVVLVLSAEPIQEPIAAHGPFVMNTKAELLEAFHDFNQGKFGFLED